MQSHCGYFNGVLVTVGDGHTAGHHVGVADGFHLDTESFGASFHDLCHDRIGSEAHLVHVVHPNDVIKQAVEVIEERHHLQCRADGTHGGEAHDVREEDGDYVVALGLYRFPRHQLFCDVPTENEADHELEVDLVASAIMGYLGNMLERSFSVRIFSAVSWLVLSSTTSSKWLAYFSSFSTMLSRIFA